MKLITFFSGWPFDRYFRLALAILTAFYAISSKEYSILIVTAWLGAMALFNISCCGTKGCNTSTKEQESDGYKNDVTVKYEEIK